MKRKNTKLSPVTKVTVLPDILRTLLRDEATGGRLILVASILALIVANSFLSDTYENFWNQKLTVGLQDFVVSMDLRHWVSEGLMALFFLVVGLEIKREVVKGQLRRIKTAILPIGAAIGGMIFPALLFLALNHNHPGNLEGWAIPIATDIAFAVGVMSLLGDRVSSGLKVFLLTLAIVDDIGAIIVIALFYGTGFSFLPFLAALLIACTLLLGSKRRFMNLPLFVLLGLGLWVAVYKSGIHPSIAGALLGFLAPLDAHKKAPVAERLEKYTIPISTFLVVPLFAFASLGVTLSANSIDQETLPLMWGVIAGLVIGKVIGISLVSWALVKLKLANLPEDSNWYQIVGVGFIAGIGFTVSVFITELAFSGDSYLINAAKISIIIASTISAIGGYLFLRHHKKVESLLAK